MASEASSRRSPESGSLASCSKPLSSPEDIPMLQQLLPAFRMTLLFTILTGLIYPGVITGLCQLIFPLQANGSLLTNGSGQVIGSSLLGQNFARPEYFHPRPSAAARMGMTALLRVAQTLDPRTRP